MLRTGGTRYALQASSRAVSVSKRPISSLPRFSAAVSNRYGAVTTRGVPKVISSRLSLVLQQTSFATKSPNGFQQGIDPEEDKKIAQRKLASHPESVTTESSVRHVYEPDSPGRVRHATEGVSDDLQTVKETFSLTDVPKEPYYLGLAGTLPYLGTSVSTVYLAWVLNTPWPSSSAFANNIMISQESASRLLATLEPIQLGYGAIIISFLGAVHWGLEYTAKVPDEARTRFRYGLGVMAPIVAWPTLILPVEFALTGQFAAFVALYFADARAAVRGWAPAWYSNYRFALTAIVGVAIAISLIGRAKVGDASPRLAGLGEKFHQRHGEEDYTEKWQDLEQKEIQKIKKQEKEAEEKKQKEEEEAKKKEKKKKGKSSSEEDNKHEKKASDSDSEGEENKEKKEESGSKGDDNKQEKEKADSEGDNKQEKEKSDSESDNKQEKEKSDSEDKNQESGKGKGGKK
ncbi:hypothetical protein F4680DRAFT_440026 [Xylaria scruposa]|nr:hypothetical protein F4680DRAFT_440026 [Xylaria scruposa]